MKKLQKKRIEEFIQLLEQAHQEIAKAIEEDNMEIALDLLQQCQQGVIQTGDIIENSEGKDCAIISLLESYCELVYRFYEQILEGRVTEAENECGKLNDLLHQIADSVDKDIRVRIEAVFLPYKASMWDSLESVWRAAEADPDCDVYVIPIPYYDKNPDGSFKQEHYEAALYPEDVKVTDYNTFDFNEHRPDIIFIHNPYDAGNYVTSVHPFFYSENLKKYTDCLVYIPYYSTSGGMSDAQRQCPAYYYADYIVIQSERLRKFFDSALPKERLLPLGSPKLDRVIQICQNPPKPPEAWKDKMDGKKVIFYNTSLTGMLQDTDAFLKKMGYVFKCFMNREDVCLLWRPHPLMESTFDSMRAQYRPVYDALKKLFLDKELGIYDDTPDITNTIALCDAYIGDSGTSVTSLFGIAGKPLFILKNHIHTAPGEEDWRGEIIKAPGFYTDEDWMVTQGNKLYRAPKHDFRYEYFCDLKECADNSYYRQVFTIGGKHYVCPCNAQDILIIGERGVEQKIELKRLLEQPGAFYGAINVDRYLFLMPNNYPAIVRYDTEKETVEYFTQGLDFCKIQEKEETRFGSCLPWGEYLLIASTVQPQILAIHAETGKQQMIQLNTTCEGGFNCMAAEGEWVWLLPYEGRVVTAWKPQTGELREYTVSPKGLSCTHPVWGYEIEQQPFARPAFVRDEVYLPPLYANMYVRLNKNTGEVSEWKPPFAQSREVRSDYCLGGAGSYFMHPTEGENGKLDRLYSVADRRLYEVNLETGDFREIPITFEMEQLRRHAAGFCENSEGLQYVCEESALNSLEDFLDENIAGSTFDKERQLRSYGAMAANADGTCGRKVYQFVRERLK